MVAFELYNGQIFPILRKDSRNNSPKSKNKNGNYPAAYGVGSQNNGKWHKFRFKIDKFGAMLSVDDVETPIDLPPKLDTANFGAFYIGGIDSTRFNTSFIFPPEFRTAVSQLGFTGCIRNVVLNQKTVRIVDWAQRSQGTEVGCCDSSQGSQCTSSVCKGGQNKCQNDSECMPSVYSNKGYTCKCKGEAADWYGRNCQNKAVYENFGQGQKPIEVRLGTVKSGHDVFSFRFRLLTKGLSGLAVCTNFPSIIVLNFPRVGTYVSLSWRIYLLEHVFVLFGKQRINEFKFLHHYTYAR